MAYGYSAIPNKSALPSVPFGWYILAAIGNSAVGHYVYEMLCITCNYRWANDIVIFEFRLRMCANVCMFKLKTTRRGAARSYVSLCIFCALSTSLFTHNTSIVFSPTSSRVPVLLIKVIILIKIHEFTKYVHSSYSRILHINNYHILDIVRTVLSLYKVDYEMPFMCVYVADRVFICNKMLRVA